MRHAVLSLKERDRRDGFPLDPVAMRVIDRSASAFGEGRRIRFMPPGRPSCLFSDTLFTVARVRAMENSNG